MSFQDRLKTCDSCKKRAQSQKQKSTVRVKSASSYNKQKKLSQLGAIIMGTSYAGLEPIPSFQTKGASIAPTFIRRKLGPIEREVKLKELGKMIRG